MSKFVLTGIKCDTCEAVIVNGADLRTTRKSARLAGWRLTDKGDTCQRCQSLAPRRGRPPKKAQAASPTLRQAARRGRKRK